MDTFLRRDEHLYTIQEAASLLGLKAGTLRAWERRFGVPQPRRAANGYRLYDSSDIELLRRLRASTERGVRIGSAIDSLRILPLSAPFQLDDLRDRLRESILRLDERQAIGILHAAIVLHPVETILDSIVEPLLVWIGEEWKVGRVSVAVEHFASAVIARQLAALHLATPDPWRPGRAVAACVPGERHEIGLMCIAVGLRRRGWEVLYLGANLPFDDLESAAAQLKPGLFLLSATSALDSGMLAGIDRLSRNPASPELETVLGGLAVRDHHPDLSRTTILQGRLGEVLGALDAILIRSIHAGAE